MQLLVENWSAPYINESEGEIRPLVEVKSSDSGLFIEGIFMQSEVVNRNGRRYPKKY